MVKGRNLPILKGMLNYFWKNELVHGYTVLKNKDEGKRKILRLTTSLTIYRLGLRGNSVNKSTRKHRLRTRKTLKSPEIIQKIFAGDFGTQRSWVQNTSSQTKTRENPSVFTHRDKK